MLEIVLNLIKESIAKMEKYKAYNLLMVSMIEIIKECNDEIKEFANLSENESSILLADYYYSFSDFMVADEKEEDEIETMFYKIVEYSSY